MNGDVNCIIRCFPTTNVIKIPCRLLFNSSNIGIQKKAFFKAWHLPPSNFQR